MTARTIAPVIPAAGRGRPRPGKPGAGHPMPLATPPGRPEVVYGFGRIDASGRVADRATIAALGWRGGDRLTVTGEGGVMVARRDPGGMVTVPARPYVVIPAVLRSRCGPGSRCTAGTARSPCRPDRAARPSPRPRRSPSAGHRPATPSAAIVARSATRPEASIRPNPYTTSGRPSGLASGTGRPAPGLPGRGRPRPAAGMTGATGRAVMAASRTGGAASGGGHDDQPPGTRVRVVRSLGEIAPKSVSEGGLEPPCPLRALAPQASASAYSATRTRRCGVRIGWPTLANRTPSGESSRPLNLPVHPGAGPPLPEHARVQR